MLNDYWQAQYEKALRNAEIGRMRRLERERNYQPGLKPIPPKTVELDIQEEHKDDFIIENRGLFDAYKNGVYIDSFDTKGAAWRALF